MNLVNLIVSLALTLSCSFTSSVLSQNPYPAPVPHTYSFRDELTPDLAEKHGNPVSLAVLKKLAAETPVSDEVAAFRAKPNPRREGKGVLHTKFFDVYYPKDVQEVPQYLKVIAEHADMAYAFLVDLWGGKQVPVEIHLAPEEEVRKLREGDIRRQELVTFLYINEQNTKYPSDLISEFVHETNHNFQHVINNFWVVNTGDQWNYIDESMTMLLGPIYVDALFPITSRYSRHVETSSVVENDLKRLAESIDKAKAYPTWEGSLYAVMRRYDTKDYYLHRDFAIGMATYLYDQYGFELYKKILTSPHKDGYKALLEKTYGKSVEELEKEFYTKLSWYGVKRGSD